MGKKKDEVKPISTPPSEEKKEGHNLLGAPTFKKLENGRLKCVETGHELPVHATDSYAQSKHCRLGLIDSALARNKPPVNMFEHDPFNRLKLICKLTGDTINKSEEHIWKHVNGKRFLNVLEKKEAEKEMPNGTAEKQDEEEKEEKKKDKKEKKKKKKNKGLKEKEKEINEDYENADEIISDAEIGSDLENDDDFWMPPAGERWDHDDGGDRWGSDSESGSENDGINEEAGADEDQHEAGKLSKKKKRTSLEKGSGNVAPKKKKKKTSAM